MRPSTVFDAYRNLLQWGLIGISQGRKNISLKSWVSHSKELTQIWFWADSQYSHQATLTETSLTLLSFSSNWKFFVSFKTNFDLFYLCNYLKTWQKDPIVHCILRDDVLYAIQLSLVSFFSCRNKNKVSDSTFGGKQSAEDKEKNCFCSRQKISFVGD